MRYLLITITFVTIFALNVMAGNKEPIKFGTIKGKVTDSETKSPIPGSTVQLIGTQLGGITDTLGNYTINKAPVGNYTIQFSCIGYATKSKTDLIVRSGRITQASIGLNLSAIEINDIKVTAGYFHETADQPTSATNFTGEEIRRAPGSAGDVSRIVAVLPSIAKVNDMINSLVVRGGSPTENAFYIDNIEVPNINHYPIQGSSGGPISLLSVDFIDNVNFSAGGFGASYGDRLSSVMEINFREGNRDEYDFQADMNVAGFGLTAEGPINNGQGSFMITGRRSYLDLLVDAIGTGVAPRFSDLQGKLVYDLTPSNRLSIIGIYGNDYIDFEEEQSEEDGLAFYGLFKGYEFALGANWRYLWNKNGYSNTSVSFLGTKYHADIFETFRSSEDDNWIFTNRSLEDIFQLRNANHYRFSEKVSVEFGVDAKYYYNDYELHSAEYTNILGEPIEPLNVDKILEAPKYGVYGQVSWRMLAKLTTKLGLRYDYFPFNEHQHIAPRFSVNYALTNRTSLKGAAGIYYQSIPLSLMAQSKDFEELDDPVSYHFIAGFEHLITPETKFTLETYYKSYKNFPLDPTQPMLFIADEASFQKIVGIFDTLFAKGISESYGIEATIQKKLAQDFYGLISGSIFKAKYRDLNGVWRDRIFDNQYLFSIEGGYKPNNKWEFSLRWILAGGPPYTPLDTTLSSAVGRTVYDVNNINGERYPAYHSLNLRIDKRYNFKSSNLIVYLSIWNVYNRKNVSMYYWNDSEQKADEMFQWSILPVIGFEFEF